MRHPVKFTIALLIFTLLLFGAGLLYFHFFPSKKPAVFWELYIYFFILTAAVHYMLVKASEKRPQQFVAKFMGALVIKLFLSLTIILIYAYNNKEDAIPFILTFSVLYMLYTGFEVITILRFLKKRNPSLTR